MKMRKGSGEIGCLIVLVILFLIIVGPCTYNFECEKEIKKLKIENERVRDINSLQIRVLEAEVRQLKALIPTNVSLKIELSDIIKEQHGSTTSH